MRILVVPPSDWISHPLTSRLHFIFERLAQKHEVHVIRYPLPLWKNERQTKAIIHKAKGLGIRDLSLYYAINSPYHASLIKKILKTNEIDIIVVANILAGTEAIVIAKAQGIPIVYDYLDHFPESASAYYKNIIAKSIVQGIVQKLTNWNLSRANQVVTVSHSFANWLKNSGIQKVTLIPNGVDLSIFKTPIKKEAQEKLDTKQHKKNFVITYVGSVETWYDLDIIAKANNQLNDLGIPSTFQIVGGSLANGNNHIINTGPNIQQTGFVNHKTVPLYINASDICVLPLKRMIKNLTRPVKLLEYFACGKPVFSLPNPEIKQEFGDAVTFFETAEELTTKLMHFIQDPSPYAKKIEKGYKYAKENSWDTHAQNYELMLTQLINENKHANKITI